MAGNSGEQSDLEADIRAHYALGLEPNRLDAIREQIERIRTQELLDRFLPEPAIFHPGLFPPPFQAEARA